MRSILAWLQRVFFLWDGLPPSKIQPTAKPSDDLGQRLCDNLNRNVLARMKREEPPADWPIIVSHDRTFAVSPDGTDVKELTAGYGWAHVDTKRVLQMLQKAGALQAMIVPTN